MKKLSLVLLSLILVQLACNLPSATAVPATPSLPPLVETATPLLVLPTTPASTETPAPPSVTPEPTATLTSTPTETLQPSPTLTETPDPAKLFSSVNLSAQVFSTVCEPKTVRFEVSADPTVYSVVLFLRLNYKTAGDYTPWNEGIAMNPGGGKFTYDLKAANLPYFSPQKDPVAWVQFQLIATARGGAILGRSEVFTNKLTLSAICP